MSDPSADPQGFDATTARSALRRGLWSVLGLLGLIALAGLAVSRTDVGAEHLSDIAARMRVPHLLAATGLMSLAFVFLGLRWRALLPERHKPPPLGLTAIILAGLLLNYALPGPMGELGAAWFAHRRYGVGVADALASGVIARAIGLASAALLGAVIWSTVALPVPEGMDQLVGLAALATGGGGALLVLLTVRPDLWTRLAALVLDPMQARLPARATPFVEKARGAVAALAGASHAVLHRGRGPVLEAAAWSCVAHLMVVVGIGVAIIGLGETPRWIGLAFTYTTTTAGAVVLFAFPGSQLGWDAMFATLLTVTADVASADAIAVSVIVRLQQLAFMLVGALAVAWLLQAETERDAVGP